MKKIIFSMLSLCLLILVTGCGEYNSNKALKDLNKKIGSLNAYKLNGVLSVNNNDDVYNYDVEVSYKKKDKYKVVLKNKANGHEQIILKNSEGVFVLTPALNKSFKFQSDWPYSNSQIYLLESILNDIKNDNKRNFEITKNEYIFKTKVNYPNNSNLIEEKITLSKNMGLKNIKVYDKNNTPQMDMTFKKIDYSPTFKNNYFNLDIIMKSSENLEDSKSTASLDDSIYPLVIPDGTKLTNEEKINKDSGERVLLTFEGEKPFLLVEETANVEEELTIIPTYGEPYMLTDTVGALSNNSLTWSSSGVDYYIVSDVLNQQEMIEVAKSINVIPTMK